MNILKNIKILMVRKNLSGGDLAKILNRSPRAVSELLGRTNQNFQIKTLHRISKALEVDAEELFK